MSNCYMYVGNWSFEANPAKGKGISVFRYNTENGSMKLLETVCPEVAAGQLCLDSENGILYSNNECGEREGEIGGGGYLLAFKINREDGSLKLMNQVDSLSPEPAYLCLDKSKKYLTVSHVSDPFFVTKVVKNPDSTYGNRVDFCDGGLVLFRINEDGSIGDACDVSLQKGDYGRSPNSTRRIDPLSGHVQFTEVISRMHSVVPSRDGNIMVVCDKGMDKVYSYSIDREAGKLKCLDTWKAPETGCFPRYSAFHPMKNLLYVNNEGASYINLFNVDTVTGKLNHLMKVNIFPDDFKKPEAGELCVQDILVNPNGKRMYLTSGGYGLIFELELNDDGIPKPVKVLDSRGNQPRGLALSPDGRFLLSGNMVSGDITVFETDENGSLTDTGRTYEAISPSVIRFFEI